jgi:MAP3K TRAFs-binding domain
MTLRTPPDASLGELLPVVRYAVERKIASGRPDYWDHATMLELAVLAKNENGAIDALAKAVAVIREHWEPETTARNLGLIREAREARGEALPWAIEIEEELNRKAKNSVNPAAASAT